MSLQAWLPVLPFFLLTALGSFPSSKLGRSKYLVSEGPGTPVEIKISAPYWDYREQKLETMFRSLLVVAKELISQKS